jgi:hypothetical protein
MTITQDRKIAFIRVHTQFAILTEEFCNRDAARDDTDATPAYNPGSMSPETVLAVVTLNAERTTAIAIAFMTDKPALSD